MDAEKWNGYEQDCRKYAQAFNKLCSIYRNYIEACIGLLDLSECTVCTTWNIKCKCKHRSSVSVLSLDMNGHEVMWADSAGDDESVAQVESEREYGKAYYAE